MPEFDIDAFIAELERLGLKLTATRLLDGTYRVNRWRMPDAISNAQQIEDLWAKHIGDDKARIYPSGRSPRSTTFEPVAKRQIAILSPHNELPLCRACNAGMVRKCDGRHPKNWCAFFYPAGARRHAALFLRFAGFGKPQPAQLACASPLASSDPCGNSGRVYGACGHALL
jgi:hypothetical protein